MRHPYDNDFKVSREQKEQFKRDGFVKLDGFLNSTVVRMLLDRVDVELASGTSETLSVDSRFNRAKYDFDADKTQIFELVERPYFRRAITDLTQCDLFLAFETSYEIEKNRNTGFPWHVCVQGFGYQFAEQFGCTFWTPLHPVNAKKQRGGLGCVSRRFVPGEFAYSTDLSILEVIRDRERTGKRTSVDDYFKLRAGILNSPVMHELLETHKVEHDFEPGDVLLFDKTVVHRSVMLEEGEMPRRAAYVMRFVDADSRYDLNRARALEFPSEQYGHGFIPYKPLTRQHIEIAEAGAKNGDLLSECDYFGDKERRLVRRTKDKSSMRKARN